MTIDFQVFQKSVFHRRENKMVLYYDETKYKQIDEISKRRVLEYGNQLMCTHMIFDKTSDSVELHHHSQEQSTYILKGKFKFFIEDKEYVVGPGDSLFFPSNVPHGCIVLEAGSELLDSFSPIREDFL